MLSHAPRLKKYLDTMSQAGQHDEKRTHVYSRVLKKDEDHEYQNCEGQERGRKERYYTTSIVPKSHDLTSTGQKKSSTRQKGCCITAEQSLRRTRKF